MYVAKKSLIVICRVNDSHGRRGRHVKGRQSYLGYLAELQGYCTARIPTVPSSLGGVVGVFVFISLAEVLAL